MAPIAIGMTLNKFFPKFVKKILPFAPVVGVVSTCLLVASAIAQVADPIKNAGMALQVCLLIFFLVFMLGSTCSSNSLNLVNSHEL